ncbi:MAG: sterol desaturase family protein [Curvibacter sp.]|nr:sterol desaturase family protein [Roseateles sp.]MBV8620308.1 sterol desaturase family protein [Curvibacter sp.]
MDTLSDLFQLLQQKLFEGLIEPAVWWLGLSNVLEDAFDATGWLLVGLLQLVVMATVLRALEWWRPVEPVSDRHAVRIDMLYTAIHKLGLVQLAMFFAVEPAWDWLSGEMRLAGIGTFQLDAVWPGVTDQPLVSFLIYLVVLDFAGYWLHRAQHAFEWWWALHSLHHSQRQMTLWSDDRNHLLDDVLLGTLLALLARFIGVAPAQFISLVALGQLMQSLQHVNARIWFGSLLERVLVSPRFHRLHHAIGLGHETDGRGTLGGHNFGVLFSCWDQLFGTACIREGYEATGIRDQLPEEGGRDYGRGFIAQQWLGLKRLAVALRPARRAPGGAA